MKQIYDIYHLILIFCLIIFITIFSIILYSIVKYRESVDKKITMFHKNIIVEILWILIPFFIIMGIMFLVIKTT